MLLALLSKVCAKNHVNMGGAMLQVDRAKFKDL